MRPSIAASGKTLTTLILLLNLCLCGSTALAQTTEQNTLPNVGAGASNVTKAPQSATSTPPAHLLKGGINFVVPRGTNIKLKLSGVPTSGLRLFDRDLSGNLYPAQVDQEITAKTSEDLYVDTDKVIPEGTIFHGRVSEIIPPRRANRPGAIRISFDRLIMPDGKRFAFHAEADNTKASTLKSKSKGLGRVAAYAAGGGIVGALVAYQLFGLDKTIAMHGYNIAGGAALGAVAATTYALMKHGSAAVLEPGDDLNMAIDTDLLLPAATDPVAKQPLPALPGLEITIQKSKLVSDGLDSYMLNLEAFNCEQH